jgi:hypothetical protein
MDRDELRRHIDSAAPGHPVHSRRIAWLILRACWPDKPEYHSERVALDLLLVSVPEPIVVRLPTCTCSTGHCVVCN